MTGASSTIKNHYAIKAEDFLRMPERCDRGEFAAWDRHGNLQVIGTSGGDLPISVHAQRHRKWRNDMAWLAMLELKPGASRFGWRGTPMRCARLGYTCVDQGTERLTAAGDEALEAYRLPF